MATVSPWTNETFDLLYAIFRRDFMDDPPAYDGHCVWFFSEVEDGKEVVFWHLTSKDDKESGGRLPDLRRSGRLPWARPMLTRAKEPEIRAWDYEESDKTIKTYVWLKDYDFLVLLKRYRDGSRRLLTSFYVEYPNYRRKLENKYAGRLG
jgi:hypothetical protein